MVIFGPALVIVQWITMENSLKTYKIWRIRVCAISLLSSPLRRLSSDSIDMILRLGLLMFTGSQLAKMKKYIPYMSLPLNL